MEFRSVNNRLQIMSRSNSWKGGSFAAALQDARGDHGDTHIFAGTGCSASQIAAHLIFGVDVVVLTLRSAHADLKVSATRPNISDALKPRFQVTGLVAAPPPCPSAAGRIYYVLAFSCEAAAPRSQAFGSTGCFVWERALMTSAMSCGRSIL